MNYYIGIDIGSTCAKTVVLDENKTLLLHLVQPTGWSSVDTAQAIQRELREAGFDPEHLPCVATGYGRVSVPFADKAVTEITCHGRGATLLHGGEELTVIDIGGQDTKIIRVEGGMVKDFVMNDKCSAGTGRFLEVMANTLAVRPDELCDLARRRRRYLHQLHVHGVRRIGGHQPHRPGRARRRTSPMRWWTPSCKKVASQARRLEGSPGRVCLTGGPVQLRLCPGRFERRAAHGGGRLSRGTVCRRPGAPR